jgi:hypothetical protein
MCPPHVPALPTGEAGPVARPRLVSPSAPTGAQHRGPVEGGVRPDQQLPGSVGGPGDSDRLGDQPGRARAEPAFPPRGRVAATTGACGCRELRPCSLTCSLTAGSGSHDRRLVTLRLLLVEHEMHDVEARKIAREFCLTPNRSRRGWPGPACACGSRTLPFLGDSQDVEMSGAASVASSSGGSSQVVGDHRGPRRPGTGASPAPVRHRPRRQPRGPSHARGVAKLTGDVSGKPAGWATVRRHAPAV